MDNKVPKGRGFGRSTISQVRPEFIVARNEGMELDQPRGSGDLEKFVQSSEQESVPFGIRPVDLYLVTFMSTQDSKNRKVEALKNSAEKPRWATDQPKLSTVEDRAGKRNDRREISSWARLRR